MKTKQPVRIAAAVAALFALPAAHAFQFDTGESDVKIRWDNTFKYSNIYRLNNPDQQQVAGFTFGPAGDGDRNFKKGLASNRLDWLSELDITKDNIGGRVSVAAWYDDAYRHSNDNDTSFTHNVSVPANQFTGGTKRSVGGDHQLMDAFIFAKGQLGDMPGRVTVGRHAVVYGETLMDGSNGIAAAQGPVDIVKAATVPGAQVKEFILPTNQISGSLQLTEQASLGAYYQLKWEKSRFFAAGSFLSANDFMGDGAESLWLGPANHLMKTTDLRPSDRGQWGAQFRFKPTSMDVEFGLYAANYHGKVASAAYADPVTQQYKLVYHQDIRTYGVSASTVIGSDNVSIEASMRDNMPLTGGVGGIVVLPGQLNAFDNKGNPAYTVGKTNHVTLVDIHLFQPNAFLKDGGSVATQLDWHEVSSITKNAAAFDSTTNKSATSLTVAFQADYFQVADGLDLSIPIVWTHNFGRSPLYAGWAEGGGSWDFGLKFTYLNTWKAGINYHQFIGHHGPNIGGGSFDQTNFDRDYLSFNLSRSF